MQMQKVRLMTGTVRKLLHRNAIGHLSNLLDKLRPPDIASILMEMGEREQSALFTVLMQENREVVAETLNHLEIEIGSTLLQQLPSREISSVLQELESDDAAEFIATLPEELAEEVLRLMGAKESEEVQGLLQYEEQTAGRIMTPNVFCLNEDLSVSEAIQSIQTGSDLEMVFYLYVTDDRNHLVGVVSLHQLLMVPPSTPLKKIMTTDLVSVTTETDQEEVARLVALYDLLGIPVVDDTNKLVGMVTVDDVIDVIHEEASEDILHLAGVSTDDHIYTSRWQSFKKRNPWLIVNLATALAAANVVAFYEQTIAAFSFLAIFLPVVAGMGGNAGTQTLTVTVRGLALGEVGWSNARSAIFKELLVGIANGIVTGLLAGLVAYFWKGNVMLGVILGAALIVNLMVAGLLGVLIPIGLKKLRIDPAIASGIFLTTITDVIGFLAFLSLAVHFLA